MKILIADAFSQKLPETLKEFGSVTNDKNDIEIADILIVRSATKVDKTIIDKAKNLKLVIRGGVGLDNIDVEYCKQKGIRVENTPEASSIAVAELTFALMLGAIRNIVKAHTSMKNGQWMKELKGSELYGKTLGIIGLGRIGTEVAKRAKAFGMRVITYTKSKNKKSEFAEFVSFDKLLRESDIISLHVPLTDETKNMINKKTISKMKDGVILVNTARGGLVNENDLVEALKQGKIKYACLDVYQNEPPINSPILSLENVLLTPHLGAQTYENMERIEKRIYEIIKDFVSTK
ncbi:MAG: hydroxyacid dehydrogenase [Candidatus Aenigmatarchaeota archaeon]